MTFVAIPGVDGIKAFRALLKLALRRFGLRAIDAREVAAPARPATPDATMEEINGHYPDS